MNQYYIKNLTIVSEDDGKALLLFVSSCIVSVFGVSLCRRLVDSDFEGKRLKIITFLSSWVHRHFSFMSPPKVIYMYGEEFQLSCTYCSMLYLGVVVLPVWKSMCSNHLDVTNAADLPYTNDLHFSYLIHIILKKRCDNLCNSHVNMKVWLKN